MAAFFQIFSDGVVGFYMVIFADCIERCLEDDVGITVVCDHDVLIATL